MCILTLSPGAISIAAKLVKGTWTTRCEIHLGQMPCRYAFLVSWLAMSGCYLVVRQDSPVTENKMPCMKLSSRLLIARPGFLGDGANHTDNKRSQCNLSCFLMDFPPLHIRKIEIWMTMSQRRKWLDNKHFSHLVQPSAELHHELSLGSVNIFFCGPSFV